MFLSAVVLHIPICTARNVNDHGTDHPWVDQELLELLKLKNKHRTIASKTSRPEDYTRYSNTRRASKVMIKQKKNLYASKLKESLRENPKRFWTYVKTTAKPNRYPNFLRDGQHIVSDTKQMADMFNIHFQSVFNTNELVDNAIPGVFP